MWRPAWVSRLASLVWVVLVWSAEPAAARAQESTAPLREHGCVGCHSLDGAAGQGPSFVGRAGSHRGVYRDGERVTVVADDAYLRRAIEAPDAEIAEGYAAGFMPRFELDETEVAALVAAIGSVPTQPAPSSGTWWPLAVGLFLFVFGHLAMSSAPLRGPLVTRFGEGGFQGLYSLVAFVGLGLIVWGYTLAPYVLIFEPPTWTRWIPNVVMPLAYTLLVMGYTTPSPTMAGMADRAASGPKGIQRITRHPALWGFALWGLAHVPANGDLKSSLVFLGVAFLSFAGMVHIDLRRAAHPDDEAWDHFEQQTSIFPFVAILAGRQKLVLSELGLWRVALGLVGWGAMLAIHQWVIGVSPLP
jgi:uncharacterized membrane protein